MQVKIEMQFTESQAPASWGVRWPDGYDAARQKLNNRHSLWNLIEIHQTASSNQALLGKWSLWDLQLIGSTVVHKILLSFFYWYDKVIQHNEFETAGGTIRTSLICSRKWVLSFWNCSCGLGQYSVLTKNSIHLHC